MKGSERGPLRVALESARANFVPMAVLWSVAFLTVFAYYRLAGVAAALEPLARWQRAHEAAGAFLSRVVFSGIVPGLFMLALPAIRPPRPWLTLAVETLWCAAWAVPCGLLYRLQAAWFGAGHDWSTLVLKTCVDQFAWTAFVLAPANAAFFFWLGRGLSLTRARAEWPSRWVREICLPNLLSNWMIWIPVSFAVFSFPPALQIQVSGLIGSFWTLLLMEIGRRSAVR